MHTIAEQFVLQALTQEGLDTVRLQKLRHRFSKEFGITVLTNIDIIEAYRALVEREEVQESARFFSLIQKRKVRTLSGIAPLSVFLRDEGCPGACIFCPTEKNMPKSYLSTEPGMQRAVLNKFDPFKQVHNRLRAFEATGHTVDKIELIVQGGTFSAYPKHYQTSFLRSALNAMNTYAEAREKFALADHAQYKFVKFAAGQRQGLAQSRTLVEAKERNETASVRCVGLTLETRPDWVNKTELKRLRSLGATRLEIGVQHTDDAILRMNRRGHYASHVIDATRLMKDAGFKFTYHMMPGLYGSDFVKDVRMFEDIFQKQEFKPDQIKFYPCVVTDFSVLSKMWKEGKFQPMQDEDFVKLACVVKPMIPEWMRMTRLVRDIPSTDILAGTKTSNLRQVIVQEMERRGLRCRCIRCREVRGQSVAAENIELTVTPYDASDGREYFIACEDKTQDILLSFLRLRIPSQHFEKKLHWMRVLEGSGLVREIHTYGVQLRVGEEKESATQHKGLGRMMLAKAEEIVAEHGLGKMAIISGIGVRDYFRGNGYELDREYMVKRLA